MLLRWLTLVVWALVAGSAVYWGFRLFARPPAMPAQAAVATAAAAPGDLTRLFGAEPVAAPVQPEAAPVVAASSRFQLIGVVAPPGDGGRAPGVALIAVDGKTPRAYRVGAVVDGELVLQSVAMRSAAIGRRGAAAEVSLELPALPPPATGVPGAAPAAPAAAAAPLPAVLGQQVRPPQLAVPTLPGLPGAVSNAALARLRAPNGQQPPAADAALQQPDGQVPGEPQGGEVRPFDGRDRR